jgi:arylsulfatase A-like enzyme
MDRHSFKWWVAGAFVCGCCFACGPVATIPDPPNILLISIDALRADHLGCYGYHRDTSPSLDALAARGTRYSHAFVNTHGTPPSHTTLLSSLYQETHLVGVHQTEVSQLVVPPGVPMVQELFSAAGWHTLAVTGGGFMSADHGFSRGFAEYIDSPGSVEQGAEILYERLSALGGQGRQLFAFFHTYQVHSPYRPPKRFRQIFGEYRGTVRPTSRALLEIQTTAGQVLSEEDFEFLISRYDGEIRFTDEVLGKLLTSLEAIGFLDNAVVVVTSDHGEEFGEHGGVLHGGKLFEELLHVPLIVSGVGVDPGVVDETLVSLVDVAPTMLRLAGLDVPQIMEGRSLIGRTDIGEGEQQRVFAQYGDQLYCVRTPSWKLITRPSNGTASLFDLRLDPGERQDVSNRFPDLAADLALELEKWRELRPDLALGVSEDAVLTQEKLDELRALGYVD